MDFIYQYYQGLFSGFSLLNLGNWKDRCPSDQLIWYFDWCLACFIKVSLLLNLFCCISFTTFPNIDSPSPLSLFIKLPSQIFINSLLPRSIKFKHNFFTLISLSSYDIFSLNFITSLIWWIITFNINRTNWNFFQLFYLRCEFT
jgi:hypothetical protein